MRIQLESWIIYYLKCKPEFDVKVDSLESALIKKVCYISDPDSQL